MSGAIWEFKQTWFNDPHNIYPHIEGEHDKTSTLQLDMM